MPVEYATTAEIEAQIADILNAAKTYGGALTTELRTPGGITAARRAAGKEVLRAIFSNPDGEYFGEYSTLVTIAHNDIIGSSVAVGIPLIVPFAGATARRGIPADVDEIDSYREHPENYTGALTGVPVPHNQADSDGYQSPISCRYNITARRFMMTGYSAQIPMVPDITDTLVDTRMPKGAAPANVKRAIPLLLKEGDNLVAIAREYGMDGKQDLIELAGGAMKVRNVRSVAEVVAEQKQT